MIDFIRTQRLNLAFKKNRRRRMFRGLDTMKNVLILFHIQDWMQIQLVANDLERLDKNVILWTVESLDKNTINIRIPLDMRILKEEDKSKSRSIKTKTEKEFESLKYDTLFDFSREDGEGIEYLSYLLAINKAEFCIGNREHLPRVYDLTVIQKKGKGVLETFGQMKVYLKNIIP